jgi:hypothetical protein
MDGFGELPSRQVAGQVGLSASPGWIAEHTVACLANADLPEEKAELAAAVQALVWSPTATVVNGTFAILRSGLTDTDLPHWGLRGLRRRDQLRRRRAGRPRRRVPGPRRDRGRLGRRLLPRAGGPLARGAGRRRPRAGHGAVRVRNQLLRRGPGRAGDHRPAPGQDPARRPDQPGPSCCFAPRTRATPWRGRWRTVRPSRSR